MATTAVVTEGQTAAAAGSGEAVTAAVGAAEGWASGDEDWAEVGLEALVAGSAAVVGWGWEEAGAVGAGSAEEARAAGVADMAAGG